MIRNSLEIIYQDDWLVAISKPSGLLVHRTNLDPGETKFAMNMLRDEIGCWVYPIHRLDKRTSGVLLFSKNQEMASTLGHMILNQEFSKHYLAIVRGYSPDSCSIDYPVPQGKRAEKKPAVSHIETLSRTELDFPVGIFQTARYSLVRVRPESGRRHQIRRHLKHIFYPIIGDRLYGDRAHNRFYNDQLEISQMLLHASELGFSHPVTGESLLIRAGLPEHWLKALENFSDNSLHVSLAPFYT